MKNVIRKFEFDEVDELERILYGYFNGFKNVIINEYFRDNDSQLPSVNSTQASCSEDMQLLKQQSLPLECSSGPHDLPYPQITLQSIPCRHHHHQIHMDNLLHPECSSDARGMMSTYVSPTQLMPCTYSSHKYHARNSNLPSIVKCGSCWKEAQDNDEMIRCQSGCGLFYHRTCIGLTKQVFQMLKQEIYAEWICDKCFAQQRVLPTKFMS
ncbi:unnamed protein product [Adineta ricciae]|uniref:PHD-type domain-containing protein n=1 Tax=Adineta ricciae TaxID=249248 RepID=A0A814JZU0_ADIRI|nr:unnamed protein product [Adineta ricciae]CAF1281298.1 unnamed protein product [Adineta ricciae]